MHHKEITLRILKIRATINDPATILIGTAQMNQTK